MTEKEALASVENLVHFLAQKWRHYVASGRLSYDDLIQAGRMGAIEAWRRFKPEVNDHYPTYAGWWIRARISEECLWRGRTVRHPVRVLREQRKTREFSPLHCVDIADMYQELRFDGPDDPTEHAELKRALKTALLGSLSHRERKAVLMYYSDEGASLQKIGNAIGKVSRERARQIIKLALQKLRDESPELREHL